MTRRLGMLVRGDGGGLAAQTWEAWRHLEPDATLLLDFGDHGRGPRIPSLYDGDVEVVQGVPRNKVMRRFLESVDVVFTCETTYSVRLNSLAREAGTEIVVQANPEMFQPLQYPDARIVFPTEWERHRHPDATILPVPVNRDVLPYRHRPKVETLYHLAAPAMLDRNGTELLLAALPMVQTPVRVIIRGATPGPDRIGVCDVEWLPHEPRPYYELYPGDADALVLPRRYGGLCLPAQESASLGWPLLCLGLAPLAGLGHAVTVDPEGSEVARMQGGDFAVHDARPHRVALAIERLVSMDTSGLSSAADRWAESLSWETLLPVYRETLGL